MNPNGNEQREIERSKERESSGRKEQTDTEGKYSTGPITLYKIEFVLKPYPTQMAGDDALVETLNENYLLQLTIFTII